MKKLFFSILLFPLVAVAQTPEPTVDPDEAVAQRYGITALDVKMQRISQAFNEIRELHKVDRSGKVGTATDALFDITAEQRQSVRQARRAKIQAVKELCRGLND